MHVRISDELEEIICLKNDHKKNYDMILSLASEYNLNENAIVYLFLKYEEIMKENLNQKPFEVNYENKK